MKFKKAYITVLAIVATALCAFAVFDFSSAERKLCDAGVYDMLSDELIDAYEKEIAGEKVLSNKTASQLERTAQRLGIEVGKLKAIILLQDLAGKTGRNLSLSELAAMNELKLLSVFKQCGDDYLSTLPEERREELKTLLKTLVKIKL